MAQMWADLRRQQLAGLPLYVMTSEMRDVCIAAAKALTLVDAEAIAEAKQHTAGYLLLPDDLLLDNPLATADTEDIRVLSWFLSTAGAPDPYAPNQMRLDPTTRILTWGRTFGGLMPPKHRRNLGLADQVGIHVPPLLFSGELWLSTWKVDAEVRRASVEAQATRGRGDHCGPCSGPGDT
jgi:hypothetical protein